MTYTFAFHPVQEEYGETREVQQRTSLMSRDPEHMYCEGRVRELLFSSEKRRERGNLINV